MHHLSSKKMRNGDKIPKMPGFKGKSGLKNKGTIGC